MHACTPVSPCTLFHASCSSSMLTINTRTTAFQGRLRQQARLVVAQGEGPGSGASPEDDESRLEAFEASVRAKKGAKAALDAAQQSRRAPASSSPGGVEWKEGSLLPEGWDEMDPLERANQLYMGKYGALYWANKAAWFSILGIGALWVLFRVVLPAAGLYRLADDLGTPSF